MHSTALCQKARLLLGAFTVLCHRRLQLLLGKLGVLHVAKDARDTQRGAASGCALVSARVRGARHAPDKPAVAGLGAEVVDASAVDAPAAVVELVLSDIPAFSAQARARRAKGRLVVVALGNVVCGGGGG